MSRGASALASRQIGGYSGEDQGYDGRRLVGWPERAAGRLRCQGVPPMASVLVSVLVLAACQKSSHMV